MNDTDFRRCGGIGNRYGQWSSHAGRECGCADSL